MHLPRNLKGMSVDRLDNMFIHVKVWDWDFLKSHDMIGEMVYPLKRVLNEETMPITGFKISEIAGNPDKYDLKKTKMFLRFSLGKKKNDKDEALKGTALHSLKHLQ
jgi:hypothetical protein